MLGPKVPSFFPDDAPNIVKDGTPQKARDGTPAPGAIVGLPLASTMRHQRRPSPNGWRQRDRVGFVGRFSTPGCVNCRE
jgi:hypothetical protein